MHTISARGLLSALALSLSTAALPAAAQENLLANGDFASDISGWSLLSPSYTTAAWSSNDAGGSGSSGAMSITNTLQGAVGYTALYQCLPVNPGTAYTLRGQVRIPGGQGNTGFGEGEVYFYPQAGCKGVAVSTFIQAIGASTLAGQVDKWFLFSAKATTPADAVSARVAVQVGKYEQSGALQAYFDDVTFFEGTDVPEQPPAPKTVTIPTAASVHGQAGTFFHTDLWAVNRSFTKALTVTATYRCQAAFGGCTATKTFSIDPRESKLFSDVVGSLFGLSETAGAIELTFDSARGQLSATSRTYTPSQPSPTNGTSIPSAASTDATMRGLFLGLASNGPDHSKGYRSNAGAYNPNPTPATLTFKLYDASDRLLGSTTRTAQANEAFQINDIFTNTGAGAAVTANATLVVTSTAPVFPFVTVIDNQSGDSIYVQPGADETQ